MSDIVVAVISAVAVVVGQYIATKPRAKEKELKDELFRQDIKNEIKSLKTEMADVKDKLDIHNGYAEKITQVQLDIALIQKDVDYIKNR